jgi:hypothetical protein
MRETEKRKDDRMWIWISIGLVLGIAIGAMYENLVIGVGIGVVLGIALWSIERPKPKGK